MHETYNLTSMKTLLIVTGTCMFLLLSCKSKPDKESNVIVENSRPLSQITRILFIGNSHTNRNNITKTIQMMAASAGDSAYSHNETQPGYSLAMHCVRSETMRTIDSLKWDFVVLQERGDTQAFPDFMVDTAVFQYTRILINAIKKNSSDTKVILYMTHAYRDGVLTFGDKDWAAQDPYVATYDGMQRRIRDNYITMSDLFSVEVAPGGILWKVFKDKYPTVNLFNADGIHALPNGSYISACAIYSTIFRKRPVGKYVPDGVTSDEAKNIQTIVYEALFKGNPNWRDY